MGLNTDITNKFSAVDAPTGGEYVVVAAVALQLGRLRDAIVDVRQLEQKLIVNNRIRFTNNSASRTQNTCD